MKDLLKRQLLGLSEQHLVQSQSPMCRLHPETLAALLDLCSQAAKSGFNLCAASSFRSFERQLMIWNNKALGVRPVLDSDGHVLDIHTLDDDEKVFAILRWSALPGASRHHWGTDLDVYDASRISAGYQVQLTVAETLAGGPFAEFHSWLDGVLQKPGCQFYRPYAIDRGGIAPEPWHLSYLPLARGYSQLFSEDILREQLEKIEFELKSSVLKNLGDIYQRFIRVN